MVLEGWKVHMEQNREGVGSKEEEIRLPDEGEGCAELRTLKGDKRRSPGRSPNYYYSHHLSLPALQSSMFATKVEESVYVSLRDQTDERKGLK